jgi:hypothetical protein
LEDAPTGLSKHVGPSTHTNTLPGLWLETGSVCILGRCRISIQDFEPHAGDSLGFLAEMVPTQANIVILGGDEPVGRSLEALLEAAGYRAWFVSEDKVDKVGELLADFQLLIVAPALDSEFQKFFLERLSNEQAIGIPILELLPVNGEQLLRGCVVLWPCSYETLKRAIDFILLAATE